MTLVFYFDKIYPWPKHWIIWSIANIKGGDFISIKTNVYSFNPQLEQNKHLWLIESEVAAITGLSVHTLRAHRRLHKGIIYHKIGRSVRYKLSDIIGFMESRRIEF